MAEIERKYLPLLTGGLNNIARPEVLKDEQVQNSLNYEYLGDGILHKRRDVEVFDSTFQTKVDSLFATEVLAFSPPYYPPTKPSDMTNDFMIVVFGNDGGSYEMHLLYDTSGGWTNDTLSGLASSGVSYTANSDPRFTIGSDKVLITDGVNRGHYVSVDDEGTIFSGTLGIPAPKARPSLAETPNFDTIDYETTETHQWFSEPGLFQCVYTVETKYGDESNPSPEAFTGDIQFFRYNTNDEINRWIDSVQVSNLTIPNVSNDLADQLKYFNIYVRVTSFSEGAAVDVLYFSQQFEIIDKTSSNTYSLGIPPGTTPVSFENDVAPIAKDSAEIGGVIALMNIREKVYFPFEFDYYVPITLNNLDTQTYEDGIVRIRLYDQDSGDSNAITNLDWNDYEDAGTADLIDSTLIHNLRIYDTNRLNPLPALYQMNNSNNYCDVWVRIPSLAADSTHTIYFVFGTTADGVDEATYQTASYGEWYSLDHTAWDFDNQKVFVKDRVRNTQTFVANQGNNTDVNYADDSMVNRADVGTYDNSLGGSAVLTQVAGTLSLAYDVDSSAKIGGIFTSLDASGILSFDFTSERDLPPTGLMYGRFSWVKTAWNAGDPLLMFCEDSSSNVILGVGIETATGTVFLATYDGSANTTNSTIVLGTTGTTDHFIAMSWDEDAGSVTIHHQNLSTGTWEHDELTGESWNTNYDTAQYQNVTSADSSIGDIQMTQYSYLDESNAGKDTIKNLGNFMPGFDNFIGYKYSDTSHNNNVSFGDTETIEFTDAENAFRYSRVNGVNFPTLFRRQIREPIITGIPSPSFLQFEYQNTILIWSRNYIHRFILSGNPSDWATEPSSLIEERTQYGLMAEKSLVRVGDELFWLSENGVIRWSPRGLELISKNIINIHLPQSQDMIGFYCPVRNQYILHDPSEGISGSGSA